jgi:hypothetical protein
MVMDEATRDAIAELGSSFRQFSRNGRWGTCGDCPRDTDGNAYPEFCENTERGDHHLNVDSLADQWKRAMGRGEEDSF